MLTSQCQQVLPYLHNTALAQVFPLSVDSWVYCLSWNIHMEDIFSGPQITRLLRISQYCCNQWGHASGSGQCDERCGDLLCDPLDLLPLWDEPQRWGLH